MMKRILGMLMFTLALGIAAGQTYNLERGSKLFIEPMPQDLDSYIKAEVVKQKIKLLIVGSPDDADYVMVGTSTEEERRKWHEGWLTAERDKTAGSVSIVKRADKSLVWAGEAGDRSIWWGALKRGGHRKVAARLVQQLKKHVKE